MAKDSKGHGSDKAAEHRAMSEMHYEQAEGMRESNPLREQHRMAARKHVSAQWGHEDASKGAGARSKSAYAASEALGYGSGAKPKKPKDT